MADSADLDLHDHGESPDSTLKVARAFITPYIKHVQQKSGSMYNFSDGVDFEEEDDE